MLLRHNKFFILLIFICSIISAEEKPVKKIVSQYTEFERKNNNVKFIGDVKVELKDGYILCDKAEYNEKEGKLFCESDKNIYFVYFSTTDNAQIEIKCSYLKYYTNQQHIECEKDVFLIYRSTPSNEKIIEELSVNSQKMFFDIKNKNLICKYNVEISQKGNKIFCEIANYEYEKGTITINENLETKQQLKFISTSDDFKIKTCQANTAVIYIYQNKILLKGKVEVVF